MIFMRKLSHSLVVELMRALRKIVLATAFIILFIIGTTTYYTNQTSKQTMMIHTYNQLAIELEQVHARMYKFQYTGTESDWQDCHEQLVSLTRLAKEMVAFCPLRAVVDLQKHVETFDEALKAAYLARTQHNSVDSRIAYAHQEYIHSLLVTRYNRTYATVLDAYYFQCSNYRRIQTVCMALSAVIAAFCYITGTLALRDISKKITRPILELADASRGIDLNSLDTEPIVASADNEIGVLVDTYNKMVCRIREQMAALQNTHRIETQLRDEALKNQQLNARLQETQMQILRAQIDPHFLYNSLAGITAAAQVENAERTAALCVSLAGYLRYVLKDLNRIMTIRDEIENIKNYLAIQQMRYNDEIYVDIEVEPACEGISVPSMILQPLVENAFVHGWLSGASLLAAGRYIGISIKSCGEYILITVCDNGDGISKDTLERLNRILTDEESRHEDSIGIYNVLSRISRYCGGNFAYQFTSESNVYTKITIELPKER